MGVLAKGLGSACALPAHWAGRAVVHAAGAPLTGHRASRITTVALTLASVGCAVAQELHERVALFIPDRCGAVAPSELAS